MDRMGFSITINGYFYSTGHCNFENSAMLIERRNYPEILLIYAHSQATNKSLTNEVSMSVLVHKCLAFLSEISDNSWATLIRVLGHRLIVGNCIADQLAKAGWQSLILNCRFRYSWIKLTHKQLG